MAGTESSSGEGCGKGPDRVLSCESYVTTDIDGAVKLRMGKEYPQVRTLIISTYKYWQKILTSETSTAHSSIIVEGKGMPPLA